MIDAKCRLHCVDKEPQMGVYGVIMAPHCAHSHHHSDTIHPHFNKITRHVGSFENIIRHDRQMLAQLQQGGNHV